MKSIKRTGYILSCLLLMHAPMMAQGKTPQSLNQNAEMENSDHEREEYILLVRLPLNYGPEQAKEVREQWNQLLKQWKEDGTYVTSFVYPNDGYLVTGPEKTVTNEGVAANDYKLVSNMILRAENYEAAVTLAKKCPVLEQGGMIEVRAVQPRSKPDTSAKTRH